MLSLTISEFITLLVLLPIGGGLAGYVVAADRLRRQGNGKTPGEMRQELEAYRSSVTTHFQRTADLLRAASEQHRALYLHMAEGAADLCAAEGGDSRLEDLGRRALALEPEGGAEQA